MDQERYDRLPYDQRDAIEDAFYEQAPAIGWKDWLRQTVVVAEQIFCVGSKLNGPRRYG